METLLKPGYGKITALFYKNPAAEIHLRDIARKTRLNENSATRFLKKLEQEAILSAKKDGNLKKYTIQKNKKTFLLFTIFSLKKYEQLPSRIKNAINYFAETLQEKPIIITLFGSTAKENYTQESDLDLLLITNKKINTETAENNAEAQTAVKINCIQAKYRAFLREIKIKEDKLLQSAIKTGYPLTNHLLYYEEILK